MRCRANTSNSDRALVEKLIIIGKGVKPEDMGELIIEREQT